MSPEVVVRKLSRLSFYLKDLLPYRDVTFEQFMADHYKVERLLELLLGTDSDVVFHLLSMRGEAPPGSYRAAFLRCGETGFVRDALARNLALGAGLRNILVHEYEEIDYQILYQSIGQMVDDFTSFIDEISDRCSLPNPHPRAGC